MAQHYLARAGVLAVRRIIPGLRIWSQLFSDLWMIEFINPSQVDDRFRFIVNPFGETYPEEDLARRTSFYRIKKYLKWWNLSQLYWNTILLYF